VLGRACHAARASGFDAFARLCGDRPFLPLDDTRRGMSIMQACLERAEPCDLVTNALSCPVPPGLTMEVVRTRALEHAHGNARSPEEHEHVTAGFYRSGCAYVVVEIPSMLRVLPRVSLAVDDEADRVRLGRLIQARPEIDLSERIAIEELVSAAAEPGERSTVIDRHG